MLKYLDKQITKLYRNEKEITELLRNGVNIFSIEQTSGIVTDGLVLWLDGEDFSNDPATTTWVDKSGNGNDAIANGFAYTSESGSDGNGSVVFDGVDDYFTIDVNNALFVQISFERLSEIGYILDSRLDNTSYIGGSGTSQISYIKYVNGIETTVNSYLTNLPLNEKITFAFQFSSAITGKIYIGTRHTEEAFANLKIYSILAYDRVPAAEEILENHNALIGG